jgi:hypothetical protein
MQTPINEQLRVRIVYSKPSTFEDGKPCRAFCGEPEADEVEIEMGNYRGEMRFKRNTFTGHNDRGHYQREGEWPLEKDWLIRMLNEAFERGRNQQRKDTRDLFQQVLGL